MLPENQKLWQCSTYLSNVVVVLFQSFLAIRKGITCLLSQGGQGRFFRAPNRRACVHKPCETLEKHCRFFNRKLHNTFGKKSEDAPIKKSVKFFRLTISILGVARSQTDLKQRSPTVFTQKGEPELSQLNQIKLIFRNQHHNDFICQTFERKKLLIFQCCQISKIHI